MKNFFVFFCLILILVFSSCQQQKEIKNSKAKLQIAVDKKYIPYFEKLAKIFSEGHNVEINVIESFSSSTVNNMEMQKEKSPDIFMVSEDQIELLASKHLINPINFTVGLYVNNALEAGMYKNELYFIPMSIDTTILVYRKNAHISLPTFLSELQPQEWLAQFTDFFHVSGMLTSQGGHIFDIHGNITINNNSLEAAGNIIQHLYLNKNTRWPLIKDNSIAHDVIVKSFINGDIDYIITTTQALSNIMKTGINIGVLAVPSWDGSHPYYNITSTKGMVSSAFSTNKDLSLKFLHFLAYQEYAQLWHEMTEEISPHYGVIYPKGSIQEIAFNAASNGIAMPNTLRFKNQLKPIMKFVEEIINGEEVSSSLAHTCKDIGVESCFKN